MRIAFYGSSLLSAYWNGAATYYRGLLRDLASRGHDVTFYEPDAFERQSHRDIDPPPWCRSVVYAATPQALKAVLAEAAAADVVVKASGVGVFDLELLDGVIAHAAPGALKLFWDVDAAATLEELRQAGADHPLRAALPRLDMVLTYGGGHPVVSAYEAFGARACTPIYNALDPSTHHPTPPEPRFAADLGFLANRLPDREACVLNVARDSMAAIGFSPATRVFEAAGAGGCLITDAWEGVELFLQPDEEVLVARDGRDVADHVASLTPARARAIGEAARARIVAEHTYARRGAEVDGLLTAELARKRGTRVTS